MAENNLLNFDDEDVNPIDAPMAPCEDGLSKPVMNLILLLDTSGTMIGSRIEQLNNGVPRAIDAAGDVAIEKETDIKIRVIEFNTDAHWLIGNADNGVSREEAIRQWHNLTAGGGTATDQAIDLCMTCLHTKQMGTRSYNPVVILVTDGLSNSPDKTKEASEKLARALTGGNPDKKDKVFRIAIGVQDANRQELETFAMRGALEDEYGNLTEDVPMVFEITNLDTLSAVLKKVTVSSLLSSTNNHQGSGLIIG